MEEEEEELQEADVLWPWPDTPPPSPEEEEEYLPAASSEVYEHDHATAAVDGFSSEPFSGPPAASSSSWSWTTVSAPWSDWLSGDDGGGSFLSGGPPSTVSAGPALDAADEEFQEADVLWPDTAGDGALEDDGAAEFWWRRCRRVEEAAAACGKREGCRPAVVSSSPIDIPVATRGAPAARRRPSPVSAVLTAHRRR